MIRSFRSKALRQFAQTGNAGKLPVADKGKVARLLARLNAASAPDQMNLPGLHFHGLKGTAAGRYSVRVTGNWRLTFAFDGEDAVDVDIEDYH
ncbi:MAG: type II toxin-antitoxin system RelE/ParE family toxin [Pacificimonas sp.]|jgi:proteic killer suppression protein|nr:type II toxin-antitoxin system RelE/ParE family toxin [Pacificimonas sp.]